MTQRSPAVALTGVRNFRDVGGLPTEDGRRVRHGQLFRSGHLAQATEEDRAALAGLGLRTVFDFRNAADRAVEGPDVELPRVAHVHLPLTDAAEGADFWRLVQDSSLEQLRAVLDDGQAAALMAESYRTLVRRRAPEHGRVLRSLADGHTPALLHCSAGKDRAGLTVALALHAVGVTWAAIAEDYLATNAPQHRYPVGDGLPPQRRELLAPLFDARLSYLEAGFAEIARAWGDTETYLTRGLGLTAAHRERLRAALLTDAAPR